MSVTSFQVPQHLIEEIRDKYPSFPVGEWADRREEMREAARAPADGTRVAVLHLNRLNLGDGGGEMFRISGLGNEDPREAVGQFVYSHLCMGYVLAGGSTYRVYWVSGESW